ncbi:MAG: NAD-dependent epimerase/dehydratase family protein [Candidatus Aenigmarchaeota archaeon]|nr:NAD-dependent epimerase/dehydratase family protein [Candidatus Aenigmarchaeota archaeon]
MNSQNNLSVLVTGGAGCIGSELVKELMKKFHVTVLDNFSSGKSEHIEEFMGNPSFTLIEGDVLDKDVLDTATKGKDIVFHLAANPDIKFIPGERTDKDLEQNTIATYRVLDAMQKNNVRKIVFSSSSVVYGKAGKMPTPEDYGPLKPTSLYGASKVACEGLISAYSSMFGMKGWIFRFANIVGDKSRKKGRTVISDFIYKLRQNPSELEILGDGKQSKSYMLVDDCVSGILFALEHAHDDVNIFNLSTTDAITVDRIAEIVTEEIGLTPEIKYTGNSGGWPGDITRFLLDTAKLKKLGWATRYTSEEAVRTAAERMLDRKTQSV